MQRAVDAQLGVHALEAVGLGRQRHVVQRRELLDLRPGRPGGGQAAGRGIGGADLLRGLAGLGPGRGRLLGIEAGLAEGLLVVERDRRRRVERHRHDAAVDEAVIAAHAGQVVVEVDLHAGLGQQLVQRLHRAARGHHRRRADLEHLDDMRRVAGAEGRDRRDHRLGIGALEAGIDLVLGLRGVEVGRDLLEHPAERLGQAVPEIDLDAGLGLRAGGG